MATTARRGHEVVEDSDVGAPAARAGPLHFGPRDTRQRTPCPACVDDRRARCGANRHASTVDERVARQAW
jgi:hypothetical protein